MTKRAIVVVDLQNEYWPNGGLPLENIEGAAANAARVIAHAREAGDLVVNVRHEMPGGPVFVPGSNEAAIAMVVAPAEGEPVIRGQGYRDVRVLTESTQFNGVRLIKTGGRHGTEAHYAVPEMAEVLGEVCGVVFHRTGEKTIYLAGDTIWNEDVAAALSTHAPDVAILNAGYAMVEGIDGAIIMGTEDVLRVHQAAPEALLIASHMEAINHCVLTRAELRAFAASKGFEEKLLTPGDGEATAI